MWSHGGFFGRDTGSYGLRFSVLGVGACRLNGEVSSGFSQKKGSFMPPLCGFLDYVEVYIGATHAWKPPRV